MQAATVALLPAAQHSPRKAQTSKAQVMSTKLNFTVCPQDLAQSSSLLLLPASLLDLGIFQTDVRATSALCTPL